jgi:hypothetical protein
MRYSSVLAQPSDDSTATISLCHTLIQPHGPHPTSIYTCCVYSRQDLEIGRGCHESIGPSILLTLIGSHYAGYTLERVNNGTEWLRSFLLGDFQPDPAMRTVVNA